MEVSQETLVFFYFGEYIFHLELVKFPVGGIHVLNLDRVFMKVADFLFAFCLHFLEFLDGFLDCFVLIHFEDFNFGRPLAWIVCTYLRPFPF